MRLFCSSTALETSSTPLPVWDSAKARAAAPSQFIYAFRLSRLRPAPLGFVLATAAQTFRMRAIRPSLLGLTEPSLFSSGWQRFSSASEAASTMAGG